MEGPGKKFHKTFSYSVLFLMYDLTITENMIKMIVQRKFPMKQGSCLTFTYTRYSRVLVKRFVFARLIVRLSVMRKTIMFSCVIVCSFIAV